MRTQPVPQALARKGADPYVAMPLAAPLVTGVHGVPGGRAQVRVLRCMAGDLQSTWSDVSFLEVSHWVMAGLKEQDHIFRVGDPIPAEAYAHSPP